MLLANASPRIHLSRRPPPFFVRAQHDASYLGDIAPSVRGPFLTMPTQSFPFFSVNSVSSVLNLSPFCREARL